MPNQPLVSRPPGGAGRRESLALDAPALFADLAGCVRGEVRFDAGSRALYATDASNYRQVPIGVVLPLDVEDVEQAVAACRRFGAPVLPRGGGTSLAGQTCNVAVVLDFTKYMDRVLEIDPGRRIARVQPGTVLDTLRAAAAPHGLTFGPDPATHTHCTLGGMIGNNSCGVHSVMSAFYGPGARTSDNVEQLEVLTYDGERLSVGATTDLEVERLVRQGGHRGEIYARLRGLRDRYATAIRERYPDLPRRVSGYGLIELLPEHGFHVARALVGSEGTCAVTLEATVALVAKPEATALVVLGYPDVYSAGDHIPEVVAHRPIGCEGFDDELVGYVRAKGFHLETVRSLPEGKGWLLVEFGGGTKREAADRGRAMMRALEGTRDKPSMRLVENEEEAGRLWKLRESGLGTTAFVPSLPDSWPGWEDSAVPPDRLGPYLRDLRALLDRYGYHAALYGHFGQGCVHCRITFDLVTPRGIADYRAFMGEAADTVVRHGGVLSGEHGDGQARAELLPKVYGADLMEAFREFKGIWDPAWKMNPGKVVEANPITANLRLGAGYRPAEPVTRFTYPRDEGRFSRAALRCVGVGECRRHGGGTMCPSYMVLREEKHSTRGRAHLLFEMLQGDVIRDGWRSEEVKESLDLCLACKGCRGDCPVGVDIATYKAEFMAHYYQGRLRPLFAWGAGRIHTWLRLASIAPRLAGLALRAPGIGRIVKWAGGVAAQRTIPAPAPITFRRWFERRKAGPADGDRVILWPDTFTNYLHPEIAASAARVLEDANFRVEVPARDACCGRPLYEFGMLDTARRWLLDVLDLLRPALREGVPIVVPEPSCYATFQDELRNLLPDDEDARRLAGQSFLFADFLERKAPDYELPRVGGRALILGHCHQKAIASLEPDVRLLRRMGIDCEVPDSGCCGMAGAFGFEKDHYELSVACGERVLLPAVRQAPEQAFIVADGFSCREQVAQQTRRTPLHLAQVIEMAIRQDGEIHGLDATGLVPRPGRVLGAALVGAALAVLAARAWSRRHRE